MITFLEALIVSRCGKEILGCSVLLPGVEQATGGMYMYCMTVSYVKNTEDLPSLPLTRSSLGNIMMDTRHDNNCDHILGSTQSLKKYIEIFHARIK